MRSFLFFCLLGLYACDDGAGAAGEVDGATDGPTLDPADGEMPDGQTADQGASDGGVDGVDAGVDLDDPEQAARDLSGEAAQRWATGSTVPEVAAWLAEQDGIDEVQIGSTSVWFDYAGADPLWLYFAPEDGLPVPSQDALEDRQIGERAVVREDVEDTRQAEEKRALLLEPFDIPEFPSRVPAARARLERRPDYEGRVEYLRGNFPGDPDLPQSKWRNWADYDLVWVSTHGDKTEDHHVIYSSRFCGVTKVLHDMRDTLMESGERFGSLVGKSSNLIRFDDELTLTDAERRDILTRGQADAARVARTRGLKCSEFAVTRGNTLSQYGFIAMEAAYFGGPSHPRGYADTLIYIDACYSAGLPFAGSNRPGAYLGWQDYVPVTHSNRVGNVLIEELIDKGRTITALESALRDGNLLQSPPNSEGRPAVWTRVGTDQIRAREVVELLVPLTDTRLSDDDRIDTVSDGDFTRASVPVRIEGLGNEPPESFTLSVEDDEGQLLYGPTPLMGEGNGDVRRVSVPLNIPAFLLEDTPYPLIARLELPEGGESTHSVTPVLGAAPPAAWEVLAQVRFAGPQIIAVTAQAVEDEDGVAVWTLGLSQEDGGIPSGTLGISGHPGRNDGACGGPTGNYEALLGVTDGRYIASLFGQITITQFDDDAFIAQFNGSGELFDQNRPEEPIQIPFAQATLDWPDSGCAPPDPGPPEEFVGALLQNDSGVCIDVYADAPFGNPIVFAGICAEPDAECSDMPCPAAARFGRCDYRRPGVMLALQGQVYNFYPAPEGLSPADARQGCELQGGAWSAP